MSFQFQCPRGHLLEGDASQARQQCVCPMCGTLFLIPDPPAAAPAAYGAHPYAHPSYPPQPGYQQPTGYPQSPAYGPPAAYAPPPAYAAPSTPPAAAYSPYGPAPANAFPTSPGPTIPSSAIGPPSTGIPQFSIGPPNTKTVLPEKPAEPPPPELLHIPCPKGHELETPVEMLDTEVLCPTCQTQFRLRRQDSLEFKKKKEEADRLREIKLGNAWLTWAIAAVVIVVIGLLAIMVASNLGSK